MFFLCDKRDNRCLISHFIKTMKKTLYTALVSTVAFFAWMPVVSFAANFFTVDDAGNVSIGNSSPQHALDVSGAMYSRLATTSSSVNWDSGNVQSITLASSPTLAFSNAQAGGEYTLILVQDGTGGRTVIWPASVEWSNGLTPTLSTAADAVDMARFTYDGSNYIGSFETEFGASGFGSQDWFDVYTSGDSLSGGGAGSGWSSDWSGDSTFVLQTTTTVNSSGKAVGLTGATSAEDDVSRTFADVESGHLYFAMRASQAVVTDYCNVELFDGSTFGTYVSFGQGPNSIRVAHTGGPTTLLNPFVGGTWYIFDVNFLSATTFRVRYKEAGSSWNAYTSPLTYLNSVSSPNKINFGCNTATNGTDFYIDQLGITNID